MTSLSCLIQCAISRCIIYFYVKSLTAVIFRDDGDDDEDGASFSRRKDVTLDMVSATCLMSRTEEHLPSTDVDPLLHHSSSRLCCHGNQRMINLIFQTASNQYFDFRFLVPYITRLF